MALINVEPFIMRNAVMIIAADDYTAAVSAVRFTPSASIVRWKGLTPTANFSFPTLATWTCDLTFAQDWSSAASLSRYLFTNAGSKVDATFRPVSGGPGVTAKLLIVPGAIGGQIDSVADATVSLGVTGTPVLVVAA